MTTGCVVAEFTSLQNVVVVAVVTSLKNSFYMVWLSRFILDVIGHRCGLLAH